VEVVITSLYHPCWVIGTLMDGEVTSFPYLTADWAEYGTAQNR